MPRLEDGTPDGIRQLIRGALPDEMCRKPGAVLYCGADALRPGRAYVMGLNPGEDPKVNKRPLIDTIPDRTAFGEYTHECWRCEQGKSRCEHLGSDGGVLASALVKHQVIAIRIADALGIAPAELFSVNAIFGRSTRLSTLFEQTGFTLEAWWERCWTVHRRFLAVVRPKVIVSLGYGFQTSAFGLLKAKFPQAEARSIEEGGRRCGREFEAVIDLGPGDALRTRIVGVPHPSWRPIGPKLARLLAEATA